MISRVSILASIISYVLIGNYITARKVFIVSLYFNILNLAMVTFWPLAITAVSDGYVSVKRLQEFLLANEKKPEVNIGGHDEQIKNGKTSKTRQTNFLRQRYTKITQELLLLGRNVKKNAITKGISMYKVTAAWELSANKGSAGIHDFNLKIAEKELCAVVGQVGAGKSTLFQVILGELDLDSGHIYVNGVVSYAAQEAWIFEGSIRNNIVFIEEFDETRYKEVVRVCALERDFDLLPSGDLTVVGEQGITLSGGQKARVNLARAIYKHADIYLLDDPLSAVDTHVGKHIFKECIQTFLKDKICVLITHQLQYLSDVKHLVLINNYRIEAQGTYSELRAQNIDSLLLAEEPDRCAASENNKTTEVSV